MKIKNPMTPAERIDLALDMMSRAKELEGRFGSAWYMLQFTKLSFKIAEIQREVILSERIH